MNTKHRVFASLASVALLASLLSACGKSSDSSSSSSSESSSGTSSSSSAASSESDSVKKPESIKLMVDGTFLLKENGQDIIEKGYEDLYGIDLIINQPAHNEYYEKVDLAFTTGDIPDVLILDNRRYTSYAYNGALYDITDLYEKSEIKNNITDQGLIDAIRLDGRLYGIPGSRGNGTITYVRGDWMKKLGLQAPKNYDEFINMLRKFKNENPSGLAPNEVIPITAAGLVNTEYPLDIYLREFYWTATPDFVKRDGKWVDGMTQDDMKQALQRMHDAYAEGLIDPEIITNKTSTCRDKFNAGKVGAFNYWAGTWNLNLYNNTVPNVPDVEVTPIPSIKETYYIERPAVAVCITSACKNPEGVFKYFLSTLADGKEGQQLWTVGVEGKTYQKEADGSLTFMPTIQDPTKPFTKTWFEPTLLITKWAPNMKYDERITNSLSMFQSNMKIYPLPPYSKALSDYGSELNSIKAQYIANIVFGDYSVEDGIAAYQKEAASYVESILSELNG